jgi:hypothetical protein
VICLNDKINIVVPLPRAIVSLKYVDELVRHQSLCAASHGHARDHENRKTPISKPPANAQRPNVQAETTRTRIRRSCEILSWDRSVIAAAPLCSNCRRRPLRTGGIPATQPRIQAQPLLYTLISQKALADRVIHHDTAFLAAYAVSGSFRHRNFIFGAAGTHVRASQPFHEFGHRRNITPPRFDFITGRISWTRVRP